MAAPAGSDGRGGPVAPEAPTPGGEGPQEGQAAPEAQDPFERKLLKTQDVVRRQERELRKREARIKEMEAKLGPLSELDELLGNDPLEALKRKGHSYDGLTERLLKETQVSPEEAERMTMRQKIEALEQEREQERQTAAQREAEQARQGHLKAIQEHFETNDALAYSAALGLSGELLSRLEAFVSENGTAPTPEEQSEIAMQLETQAREHAVKTFGSLAKRSPEFRELLRKQLAEIEPSNEQPDQQAPETVTQRKRNGARPRTVTRDHLSAVETRKGEASGLTLEERIARGKERARQKLAQN